ncbi:MAG: hypothetical protein JO350_07760 [Candidatus Eremiobacteraeota bacterium]|nr:hypothetical protein [Candidatus Eremiobacteraeota bacterium]
MNELLLPRLMVGTIFHAHARGGTMSDDWSAAGRSPRPGLDPANELEQAAIVTVKKVAMALSKRYCMAIRYRQGAAAHMGGNPTLSLVFGEQAAF